MQVAHGHSSRVKLTTIARPLPPRQQALPGHRTGRSSGLIGCFALDKGAAGPLLYDLLARALYRGRPDAIMCNNCARGRGILRWVEVERNSVGDGAAAERSRGRHSCFLYGS